MVLKNTSKNIYESNTTKFFINEKLSKQIDEKTITQLENVSKLPGIIGKALAMPDVHLGYGFPIGGVAGFDKEKGIVSPGGIGFDINCGVRVLVSNFTKDEVEEKKEELLDEFLKRIDVGIGNNRNFFVTRKEVDEILEKGVIWAVEKGMATKEDLEFCEENGCFKGANKKLISQKAKGKGMNQMGSLGSGNHFVEIQYVENIFDNKVAKKFGITKKNQVVVMIHCGSRGLGRRVAIDYIDKISKEFPNLASSFKQNNLEYAPINSKLMQDYLSAMYGAANYAFCNRQILTHNVRKSFEKVLGDGDLKLVYDVSHNIAKFEKYEIDGEEKEVLVHRKGATRSFGKDSLEIPKKYMEVGQPVLLPGSMGTGSYILCGNNNSKKISLGSCAHGAGRLVSRSQAKKKFNVKEIEETLKKRGILVKGTNESGLLEEAPQSYKDVDEVVKTIDDLDIANLVVRLKPMGVIKG